jgi:hypothetical protein
MKPWRMQDMLPEILGGAKTLADPKILEDNPRILAWEVMSEYM